MSGNLFSDLGYFWTELLCIIGPWATWIIFYFLLLGHGCSYIYDIVWTWVMWVFKLIVWARPIICYLGQSPCEMYKLIIWVRVGPIGDVYVCVCVCAHHTITKLWEAS